jgi:hypothetical protein
VRRAWENIAAREHILYEKHNIHRRAISARRALRNKRVVRALADWAAVPLKDSREGFDDFIDRGNVGYDRRGDHRHRFSASLHDTLMARVEARKVAKLARTDVDR